MNGMNIVRGAAGWLLQCRLGSQHVAQERGAERGAASELIVAFKMPVFEQLIALSKGSSISNSHHSRIASRVQSCLGSSGGQLFPVPHIAIR